MAFPSSAWKYVPSSGVPNPPRWPPPRTGRRAVFPEPASGARWVARHWLKLESAGACSGRASGSVPGARSGGFASRWAPRGPIGVLVWAAFFPVSTGRSAPDGRWWEVPLAVVVRLGTTGRALLRARVPPPSLAPCAAPGAERLRRAVGPFRSAGAPLRLNLLHRMEQDYPLNLSISLSGGKETNRDAPSNGE